MLGSWVYHIRQAAKAAGVRWSSDCDAELEGDREELERRLVAAEEQAAAAWAVAGAVQKALEELRQGTAEDLATLERRQETLEHGSRYRV